jgi:hypothetical protein
MRNILPGLLIALLLPHTAYAVPDRIIGTEAGTGVMEEMTPEDAGALVGVGGQGLDANFDVTTGNVITGADESKPFTIYGSGGQTTSGVVIYRHSSGKTVIRCVEATVIGPCDVSVELTTGKVWGVKNNGGTYILKLDESTGKFSTFTVDGEDSGVSITLYNKLCGGDLVGVDPASGTAGHIWNKDPLSTAPTATAVTGTNMTTGVATFPDSDGDYGVALTCELPSGFTGAVDAVVWWKTTGSGNARFQIATKCYADDEADDASMNTASVVTAVAGTSGRPNRQAITGITVTGCAAGELMRFRFFRNRTEASDTLNAALDVEKVELWGRNTY